MNEYFLEGIRIQGYRSFKDEIELSGLSKINLIIGQNNSGKSNVLRFLTRHFPNLSTPKNKCKFDPRIDYSKSDTQDSIRFAIQLSSNSPKWRTILNGKDVDTFRINFFAAKKFMWFYYEESDSILKSDSSQSIEETLKHTPHISHHQCMTLSTLFRVPYSHGNIDATKKHIALQLYPDKTCRQNVDLIPAIRSTKRFEQKTALKIKEHSVVSDIGIGEHSGIHLIDELFQLKNPILGKEEDSERFNTIQQFMRDVIGNDTLKLEIPHNKENIIIEMDNKRLPIEELGSGIEEVLIIAAKATIFSKQIVCIEEPELHLHPSLQRKLLKYLYDKTDNQYFIATHSAHFLDSVPASIYHIKLEDGYSKVIAAISDIEKFTACLDLGYKPSDLLQANFIIWVEGPSDRIYLNHWIKSIEPNFTEGLHYSIMFYGGKLLSHLSAEDEEVTEFIKLQRLNQNMAILIDSDKKASNRERINSTKQRIKSEFQKREQFVWITNGREIENYISDDIYQKVIRTCHPKGKEFQTQEQFGNMTTYNDSSNKECKINKVSLAREVSQQPANLDVLDLKKQITTLIEQIHKANLLDV